MTHSPRPSLLWRLAVTAGVGTLAALTFSDPAWEAWKKRFGERLSREQAKSLLVGTAVIHAGEAVVTYGRARGAGIDRPGSWAVSNFLWGFPVARKLSKVRAELGAAEA